MIDEEYDYFGWTKTGHFNLIAGALSSAVMLWTLATAIEQQSTTGIVIFSILLAGALGGLLLGVRQLRDHRARHKE